MFFSLFLFSKIRVAFIFSKMTIFLTSYFSHLTVTHNLLLNSCGYCLTLWVFITFYSFFSWDQTNFHSCSSYFFHYVSFQFAIHSLQICISSYSHIYTRMYKVHFRQRIMKIIPLAIETNYTAEINNVILE